MYQIPTKNVSQKGSNSGPLGSKVSELRGLVSKLTDCYLTQNFALMLKVSSYQTKVPQSKAVDLLNLF